LNSGGGVLNSSTTEHKKVRYFEDLVVYQKACALANGVYALTRRAAFAKDPDLVSQIRRAAVSVMSNVAEGFERGSNTEFVQFLYIAKGSCGEVRAQFSLAFDQGYLSDAEHRKVSDHCRLVSGMLSGLIDYLKGARYRGDKFRQPESETVEDRIRRLRTAQLASQGKNEQAEH
jgi:four helix bundle protein